MGGVGVSSQDSRDQKCIIISTPLGGTTPLYAVLRPHGAPPQDRGWDTTLMTRRSILLGQWIQDYPSWAAILSCPRSW